MNVKYKVLIFLLFVGFMVNAQRKPKIKGSRVVVEVKEDLEPFTAIELNDDLDIKLKKSSDFGYSLTIDDNLVDILKFRVVDQTLTISSFYTVSSKKKMEITIFYNDLNAITMRDGKIESEDLISTSELTINTFGSSKLKLNANAEFMNILMVDNSFADLNVGADTLNISLKDRVDAKIYAVSKLNTTEMYKNAQVKMEGTTDVFNINLYESSDLKADKLDASDINLTLGGSTSAYVNSFNTINLSSKESAKTYLYGGGKITIIDFLDTSQLIKK
ncbi:GIN domain-containing protein [Cellulophaga tyrosinoxydans]|uniref:Putative auto-transporter adhesin, head GIN domain n=1 Tax=Cellulophaga tyrosinoxydans TaxID=504486 RepID=A0A1W1YE89_9FLAO|nr:DUF2807 domain-containing protein [Cellulophaga tyrosinoxydans]SMC34449.1 Putative auto-transporter adhesin, head GIN domain [Cellulophaga tyrosinoxydans]